MRAVAKQRTTTKVVVRLAGYADLPTRVAPVIEEARLMMANGPHLRPHFGSNDTGRHATPGSVDVPLSLRFVNGLAGRQRLGKVALYH